MIKKYEIMNMKRKALIILSIIFCGFSVHAQNMDIEFIVEEQCNNEIVLKNLSTPINNNTFFLWKISKLGPPSELIYETVQINPRFVLSPGSYEIKLFGWQNFDSVIYSSSIVQKINEVPSKPIFTEDKMICSSEKETIFEVSPQGLVDCIWSITPEGFVKDMIVIDNFTLEINWETALDTEEVAIGAVMTDTIGCVFSSETEILLIPLLEPDGISVIRKSNSSNVLVCIIDSTSTEIPKNYLFKWGYFNQNNGLIIEEDLSDQNFFDFESNFSHSIQTSEYEYFVKIVHKDFQHCEYYIPLIDSLTDFKGHKPLNSSFTISQYPNPVRNSLTVELFTIEEDTFSYSILDMFGREKLSSDEIYIGSMEVQTHIFDTEHLLNGFYILRVVAKNSKNTIHNKFIKK
jgi:hypothetical protein